MNIMDLAMKQLKNFSNREVRQLKVGYYDEPQFDSRVVKTHLINELITGLELPGSCINIDSDVSFYLPFDNILKIFIIDNIWGKQYFTLNNTFEYYNEIIDIFEKLIGKYKLSGYHITMIFDGWVGNIQSLSAERSISNPNFKNWEKTDIIYFKPTK